jgi:hypothetical protein
MTTNTTETIELAEEQIEFMHTYFCALGCARCLTSAPVGPNSVIC